MSQPPYFPRDRAGRQVFLAGGVIGDEIARRVIAQCATHLTPGGRALVLSSWARDAEVPHPPGTYLLELYTPVGDIPDTQQSMVVVERAEGEGWRARFEVPGECWGSVRPWRIDELIRSQRWLRGMRGDLSMVVGASSFVEGSERFVQARSEALLPTRLVADAEWSALRDPASAPLEVPRRLVALGWLVPK